MKKLIHQYITTGTQLNEHQFNQLNRNQLNSYLRVRVMGGPKLTNYEIIRLEGENLNKYITSGVILDGVMFNKLNDDQVNKYLNVRVRGDDKLEDYELVKLSDNDAKEYIIKQDDHYLRNIVGKQTEEDNKLISLVKRLNIPIKYPISEMFKFLYDYEHDLDIVGVVNSSSKATPLDIHTILLELQYGVKEAYTNDVDFEWYMNNRYDNQPWERDLITIIETIITNRVSSEQLEDLLNLMSWYKGDKDLIEVMFNNGILDLNDEEMWGWDDNLKILLKYTNNPIKYFNLLPKEVKDSMKNWGNEEDGFLFSRKELDDFINTSKNKNDIIKILKKYSHDS